MVMQYRLSLLALTNLNNSHKPRFFTLSYVFYIIQARSSRCMNQLNMLSLTSNSSHMKMTRQTQTLKTLQRHFNSHPSLSNPHFIHVFLFFFFFFFFPIIFIHASCLFHHRPHRSPNIVGNTTPLAIALPFLSLSFSFTLFYLFHVFFLIFLNSLIRATN